MNHSTNLADDVMKEEVRAIHSETFPGALYRCLYEIEELKKRDEELGQRLISIVSWQQHGRAFKIHNRKKFVDEIMPIWFSRIKCNTFFRQLSLYGFKRITSAGPDKGGEITA